MLEHENQHAVEPRTPSPLVVDLLVTDPTTNADPIVKNAMSPNGDRHAACRRGRRVPVCVADYDVLVQVVGEVTVHRRGVHAADEVELLTLLTCIRDERPNVDTIANMLNTELGPNTIQSRVSRLARKLGVGSDGQDLIPPAATGRVSPGRYQVSPLVLTDVELIDHRYQTSLQLNTCDAIDTLRDGLTLFTGPSFRARRGYD